MSALCRFCRAEGVASAFCRLLDFFRARHAGRNGKAFLAVVALQVAIGAWASPPAITVQPQPRTVVEGSSYTFTVTATGTSPLSYQWRRDNSALVGKTSSTLALTSIQTNDAGIYT